MYCVDYRGVSEAMQLTLWREEALANTWRFKAKIDAAQHADLYMFLVQSAQTTFTTNRHISKWETIKEVWDLISYSVQRNIIRKHA